MPRGDEELDEGVQILREIDDALFDVIEKRTMTRESIEEAICLQTDHILERLDKAANMGAPTSSTDATDRQSANDDPLLTRVRDCIDRLSHVEVPPLEPDKIRGLRSQVDTLTRIAADDAV